MHSSEVREYLHINRSKLSRMVSLGQLTPLSDHGRSGRLFDRAEVERVAAERSVA
jgi:hypothetical protein